MAWYNGTYTYHYMMDGIIFVFLIFLFGARGIDKSVHVAEPEKIIPKGPDMSQRLDSATDVIGLVQVVQANKARQISSSEQVPGKCGVRVDLLYFVFCIGWVEGGRNIGKRWIFDFVVIWQTVEGSLG